MRKRHQTGGVKQQRGRWLGQWWIGNKRVAKVLGLVKEMTKGEARQKVAEIVAAERAKREADVPQTFGSFVEGVYFPYYTRKWKRSTRDNNINRVRVHLVTAYKDRELPSLRRDELQDLLDAKAEKLSFSVVDHLRWDLKQICDMAEAEGQLVRNPARLLFTPQSAPRPTRKTMTIEHVRLCFQVLGLRERLIAKLAILAGMRPGEIFGLQWPHVNDTYVDIRQRVYRNVVDTPKTYQSIRQVALPIGMRAEVAAWRSLAIDLDGWVFPSENLTPLSKDNCWRRTMGPRLQDAGLGWATFQVMRRTHATLMKELKADPKLVADQLGHSLDVSLNVYTQSPVESRIDMVNKLEQSLLLQ